MIIFRTFLCLASLAMLCCKSKAEKMISDTTPIEIRLLQRIDSMGREFEKFRSDTFSMLDNQSMEVMKMATIQPEQSNLKPLIPRTQHDDKMMTIEPKQSNPKPLIPRMPRDDKIVNQSNVPKSNGLTPTIRPNINSSSRNKVTPTNAARGSAQPVKVSNSDTVGSTNTRKDVSFGLKEQLHQEDSTDTDSTTDNSRSDQKTAGLKRDTLNRFSFVCGTEIKTCIILREKLQFVISIVNPTRPDSTLPEFFADRHFNSSEFLKWLQIVNPGCSTENELLSATIPSQLQDFEINTRLASQQNVLDSLASAFQDFDKVAGEIHLNAVAQRIYRKKDYNGKSSFESIGDDTLLVVKSARIQTDNNRLSDVTLDVALRIKGYEVPINPISNTDFSISFEGLNRKQFFEDIPELEVRGLKAYFNYGDLMNYQAYKDEHSYIVRNANYVVQADSSVKVYKRSYSDYFSFRTFLDPLGFLGNSANSFAQLEGDFILPLRVNNVKKLTKFPQFHCNFSYIYSNSINSAPRVAPVISLTNRLNINDSNSYYIHNLDLPKYSYYQFFGKFALFAWEVKNFNSFFYLEAGAKVLGAKVGSDTSSVIVNKFIPELTARLEMRPDYIIGASLNASVSYLGNAHEGNNTPNKIDDPSFLYRTRLAFPHEINVYAYTGTTTKGGFFFRYLGWLAFNSRLSKSIRTDAVLSQNAVKKSSYFPQILLGYSTNISALVKRSR